MYVCVHVAAEGGKMLSFICICLILGVAYAIVAIGGCLLLVILIFRIVSICE